MCKIVTSVVVCTDLSGKELHRHVCMCKIVTPGSLCGVMVITLAHNTRGVSSKFRSMHNISHFHHTQDIIRLIRVLVLQVASSVDLSAILAIIMHHFYFHSSPSG